MRLLINESDMQQGGVIDASLVETMEQAAQMLVRGEGVDPEAIEISLSFVSAEEIHALNRNYRGVDRVTDVLSFPLVEDLEELPGLEEADATEEDSTGMDSDGTDPNEVDSDATDPEDNLLIPLGDVVICLDKAREQAEEYGHSERREVVYLFVHSVLHLLGYDHMEEDEKKLMRQREEEVMQALELPRQ